MSVEPVLSLTHRDYWHCFEQLLKQDTCGRLGAVSLAVQQTIACPKLLTAQGRGRFFIRLMLSRRILGNVVKHLCCNTIFPFTLVFSANGTLLHPPLQNCSFLDESWLLPVCETHEAVPCRELGMVLRYLNGRVFVLELLHGRMAQVNKFAEPGDIIDEINGISLRNSRNGQAGVLLSQLRGQPLTLRVLHWRGEDGAMYRPLVSLLQRLQQENPSLWFGPDPARILYSVRLLGKANIGMVELFQHHFPEISCVGRFGQPDFTIFAFCVV
uniref:PDZ domain-containing protein n=1 Tax=Electrophorus electricus TaxID=8005 RepID=A0A4W4FA91_ELEEL